MSKGFSIDLTGVTDEWPVVPEGVYNGKITGASFYTKEDTGNTVFVFDLEITSAGEFQSERMRYFHTFITGKPAMSKRNLIRLLRALNLVSDVQTSGDPKQALKIEFVPGGTEENSTIVKSIRINDKEHKIVGLRCNIVSSPRVINDGGRDRTVSSVSALEPYEAVKKEQITADLWNRFPK